MTTKSTKRAKLGWIGVWATVWWGISCAYVLLLVWSGKDYYVAAGNGGSIASLAGWRSAIGSAYRGSSWLPVLLVLIVVVWIIGGWLWLRELKHQNVSYRAGLKDLFLTIRK